MEWIKTPKTLDDGWYWWRHGASCSQDDYEILQVCNGFIIDTVPSNSYGTHYDVYEHMDFSGEWNGPLSPPK